MFNICKFNQHIYVHKLYSFQFQIMASNSKDSSFNILGSSKLNTADGKNPTSPATTSTSTQPGTASGQKNSEEYRQECNKAHDALGTYISELVFALYTKILSRKPWSGLWEKDPPLLPFRAPLSPQVFRHKETTLTPKFAQRIVYAMK